MDPDKVNMFLFSRSTHLKTSMHWSGYLINLDVQQKLDHTYIKAYKDRRLRNFSVARSPSTLANQDR